MRKIILMGMLALAVVGCKKEDKEIPESTDAMKTQNADVANDTLSESKECVVGKIKVYQGFGYQVDDDSFEYLAYIPKKTNYYTFTSKLIANDHILINLKTPGSNAELENLGGEFQPLVIKTVDIVKNGHSLATGNLYVTIFHNDDDATSSEETDLSADKCACSPEKSENAIDPEKTQPKKFASGVIHRN